MTVEGPLGSKQRGSWLISGRKSYLDLLVRKLREEGLSFGFADAQVKLRHDVGANHSAAVTFLVGKSRLRELPEQVDDSDLFTGDNASAIGIGSWRTVEPGKTVTAEVELDKWFKFDEADTYRVTGLFSIQVATGTADDPERGLAWDDFVVGDCLVTVAK